MVLLELLLHCVFHALIINLCRCCALPFPIWLLDVLPLCLLLLLQFYELLFKYPLIVHHVPHPLSVLALGPAQ